MGRNLTNLYISESFQYVVQISGSELQDGLGNKITGALAITASNAVSASYFSGSISNAVNATSASYASYTELAATASYFSGSISDAVNAIYSQTASYLNPLQQDVQLTGSLLTSVGPYLTMDTANGFLYAFDGISSVSPSIDWWSRVLKFSNGNPALDWSGAYISIPSRVDVSGVINANGGITGSLNGTASNAISASHAIGANTVYTQQTNANQSHYIAFVATTNDYEILETDNSLTYNPNTNILNATVTSASYALTASYALNGGGGGTVDTGSLLITASISNATTTFTKGDGTTFTTTVNNVNNAVTASYLSGSISNLTDTYSSTARVFDIVTLTVAEYAALGSKNANTLYITI